MPSESDEEAAVVTKVRWPPVLGIGHEVDEVLFDSGKIERFEFLSVIKILPHRIGEVGVLAENIEVEVIRPPVPIAQASGGALTVIKRAFASLGIEVVRFGRFGIGFVWHKSIIS